MKFQLLLMALFSALLFTACQPEEDLNCRDNRIAVYEGSDGFGGTNTADIQEGAGEKGVLIVYTSNNPFIGTNTVTITGELDESCSTLTIPKQMVGTNEIEGSFTITDDKLSGTLTRDGTAIPVNIDRK